MDILKQLELKIFQKTIKKKYKMKKNNKLSIIKMIKTILLIVMMINMLVIIVNAQGLYYEIDFFAKDDAYKIKEINVKYFNIEPVSAYNPEYFNTNILLIYDKDNILLERAEFSIPNKAIYEVFNETGDAVYSEIYEMDEYDFKVYIKYNENAKYLEINDESENRVLERDIDEFSVVQDKVLESELTKVDIEKKIKNSINSPVIILILILMILFILIIIFLLKNKKIIKIFKP